MGSKDWHDNGEGSENMKRAIAKSARNNPVPKLPCASCRQLQARIDALTETLGDLADIQNGPPLYKHTTKWNLIMDKAYKLLERK